MRRPLKVSSSALQFCPGLLLLLGPNGAWEGEDRDDPWKKHGKEGRLPPGLTAQISQWHLMSSRLHARGPHSLVPEARKGPLRGSIQGCVQPSRKHCFLCSLPQAVDVSPGDRHHPQNTTEYQLEPGAELGPRETRSWTRSLSVWSHLLVGYDFTHTSRMSDVFQMTGSVPHSRGTFGGRGDDSG